MQCVLHPGPRGFGGVPERGWGRGGTSDGAETCCGMPSMYDAKMCQIISCNAVY